MNFDKIKKAITQSVLDVKSAPFVREMCKACTNMYRLGWDERNGGNISLNIDEKEAAQYLDLNNVKRTFTITFDASYLAGKLYLVTGTGKYFKNVESDPKNNLGIIRVGSDGKTMEILWGYEDGGRPTSELPAHFMSHIERLKVDPNHKIVIHSHCTNVIAMTFVHSLDEKEFTKTLWYMITECLVVFPDGVGVLPWMVCGTDEIGLATAEKMRDRRLCVWGMHGIFGTGTSIDEAFGLIETVEKAAEIYMKIADKPIKAHITDDELRELAVAFNLTPRAGYLD